MRLTNYLLILTSLLLIGCISKTKHNQKILDIRNELDIIAKQNYCGQMRTQLNDLRFKLYDERDE